MKKNYSGRKLLTGVILTALFVIFTAAVKLIDVKPIGPEGSSVGLATLNGYFQKLIGTHSMWYNLTKLLGVFAFIVIAGFVAIGIVQLVERKSLKKVDGTLYLLAAFYIVVAVLYVFFEKYVINCRPIILSAEEGLEASYPSSHTMLVVCVMGSGIIAFKSIFDDGIINVLAYATGIIIAGVTVVGRLLSGVHWFTDIVGAMLVSAALIEFFDAAVTALHRRRARR